MSQQYIITKDELQEIDKIFEKILIKIKNTQPKEYILQKEMTDYIFKTELREEIEKGIDFVVKFPFCFLERINKENIEIQFLVKAKFIDEEEQKFSFWVCSLEFLKAALKSLDYKEAKIIKKKKILLSEEDEQENKDKDSARSSSESLNDKSTLDIELIKYEVRVSKNPFNLEKIFNKSQKIFNPVLNNDNFEDYLSDLTLSKKINKENFVCNKNYLFDLRNIFHKTANNYFYCYNEKSGLTLSLLQILEQRRESFKSRYFHFNSEHIEKYKKDYFYFKIGKLFKEEEKNSYKNLIENKNKGIINYDIQYIADILTEIIKKFNDIYIIFDNIKNDSVLNKIKKVIDDLRKIDCQNKFTIYLFIAINSSTLFPISNLEYFSMIFPRENSYKQILPINEYTITLLMCKDDYKKDYIEKYKNNIKDIITNFNDDSINYFIFLIELFYNSSFKGNNIFIDFKARAYLIKFLPYIYISLCNKYLYKLSINRIQFRADFIKEIIYDNLNLLISQKMLTEDIFKGMKNKSTEGIYLEKQIIYHLIIKNIEFDKIKIKKIYCFDSILEKNIIKSKIIFIQELERAPLYDFGIITNINGELIFKGYLIGINKPRNALLNLSKEKIKLDILYFINKINQFLNIKINKFCFGIITTINAYYSQQQNDIINFNINDNDIEKDYFGINEDSKEEENDKEYKNYKIMKDYCYENNFEFILFDPKNNNFSIEDDYGLKVINFNYYFNSIFSNNVTNLIFNNENLLNIVKLPLIPREITKNDIQSIKESVIEIKNKKLNFIGKFLYKKEEQNETIKEEKLGIRKVISFDNLINDNYLIYAKDEKENKIIFYNNRYFCKDYKDIDIFYVFTLLDRNKKNTQIILNDLKSENYYNNIFNFTKNPNDKNNSNFLNKKKFRNNNNETE